MSKKGNEDPRELVDLDVNEVSMVDRPANLRQFLVVKRLGGNHMGAFQTDTSIDPSQIGMNGEGGDSSNGSTVEVSKALTDEVKNALGTITSFLSKATEAGDEEEAKKAFDLLQKAFGKDEDADKKKEEEEKAKMQKAKEAAEAELDETKKRHAHEAELQKAGKLSEEEEEMSKRHEAELAKAKAKAEHPMGEDEEEEEKTKGVTKSVDGDDDEPTVKVFADGRVEVTKAKSFSKKRTKAVTDVFRSIATMLKEVDPEGFASVVKEVSKSLPSDASVSSKVRPDNSTGVTKSADGGDGEVIELLKGLGNRIEAIEKSRSPSTSVEGDGGSETKTAVNKSFWDGVL